MSCLESCNHGSCIAIASALSQRSVTASLAEFLISQGRHAVCACHKGWIGFGDFIDNDGISCQIHKAAVYAGWFIYACFALVAFAVAAFRAFQAAKRLLASLEQEGEFALAMRQARPGLLRRRPTVTRARYTVCLFSERAAFHSACFVGTPYAGV